MVYYPKCSEHRGPRTLPPPCLAIYRPGSWGLITLSVLPGLPPVGQQGQGGGRLGVGGHDPVVGAVGGHRVIDQPGADQLQGLAFPGLLLPPVLGQLRGASRSRRARKPPPASMAASCRSSPTSTTFAPARWAWSRTGGHLSNPSDSNETVAMPVGALARGR
jgi:hypothetical protein